MSESADELWLEVLRAARTYTEEFKKVVDNVSSRTGVPSLITDLVKIEAPVREAVLKYSNSIMSR